MSQRASAKEVVRPRVCLFEASGGEILVGHRALLFGVRGHPVLGDVLDDTRGVFTSRVVAILDESEGVVFKFETENTIYERAAAA